VSVTVVHYVVAKFFITCMKGSFLYICNINSGNISQNVAMFVAFLVVSVCCAGSDVTTTVAASSTTFSDTNTTIMSDGNLSVPTALLARRMLSALDC